MKPEYKWWTYMNHLCQIEQLKIHNDYEYILLGDSITEYWTTAGNEYWNKIKNFCFNAGVGGDKIKNLYYRLNPNNLIEMKLLDKINFKKIILMIGTNNIYKDTIEDIVDQYKFLIDYLLKYNKEIIVFGIIPILNSNYENKISDVNEEIKKIVQNKNFKYCYFGNYLTENHYCDNEHLNSQGYKIWYEYLSKEVF